MWISTHVGKDTSACYGEGENGETARDAFVLAPSEKTEREHVTSNSVRRNILNISTLPA